MPFSPPSSDLKRLSSFPCRSWSSETSFSLYLREMLFGSRDGLKWFIPPNWKQFYNPRLIAPNNPLWVLLSDMRWSKILHRERATKFHRIRDYLCTSSTSGTSRTIPATGESVSVPSNSQHFTITRPRGKSIRSSKIGPRHDGLRTAWDAPTIS